MQRDNCDVRVNDASEYNYAELNLKIVEVVDVEAVEIFLEWQIL